MKKFIKFLFFIVLFFGIVIVIGIYQTKSIKVNEYNFISKKLPNSFNGLKIVHFGDLLYGSSTDKKMLDNLSKKINELKPDVIIYTGDAYSSLNKLTAENIDELKNFFSSLDVSLEKYAIRGDNDKDEYSIFMHDAGFSILDDSFEELYYKGNIPILISNTDAETDLFTIRLIHKPDDADKIILKPNNMILAGHGLTGQIRLPFDIALIKKDGAKKYTGSYYEVNKSSLYITSGIGTYSPNIRIFNSPSVNLYRLTNY